MSVVPLAIAHAFVDKKSTSFKNNRIRVVNLMDRSSNDRMQPMHVVCRREDVRISENGEVVIASDPAFAYLTNSIGEKLGVGVVFFQLDLPVVEPIVHSSTEEFSFEYCIMELDMYEILEVDRTARAATFRVRFV